jgi:hypothetical protein
MAVLLLILVMQGNRSFGETIVSLIFPESFIPANNTSFTNKNECDLAILTAAVTQQILCFGGTGTVTISATGGTAPYSYTFNGVTNSSGVFTGVSAGENLAFSITDANNCGPVDGSISVTQPPLLALSGAAVTQQILCFGGTGTVTISATGGTAPYSYTFNGVTNSSGVFTGVSAGENLAFSITDANNCGPVDGSISVTQPPLLALSGAAVTQQILCFGGTGTVTISATGGTAPYSYTFNGVTNSSGVFTGVSAGENLAFSITDANNCGPVNGSISVTQPPLLALSGAAVTQQILCFGGTGTVTISATGGKAPYSYTFNGVANSSGVFTGVSAGENLAFSITDANNCGPVDGSISVTQPPLLALSGAAVTQQILCFGGTGTVTISATGGTAPYSYTFNGVTNSSGVFTGVSAGENLAYSITDANNCGPVNGSISVTQPPLLALSGAAVTQQILCFGGTGTVTISATGGTAPYSYTFNGVANSSGVFTGVAAGENLAFSITDANNCGPVNGSISVTQPPLLALSGAAVTQQILCFGGTGTVTISATGGTAPYSYTFNGVANSSGVFTGVAAGENLAFSITDANNCGPVDGSISVTQPPLLALSGAAVTQQILCFGGTGTVTISATGGTAPYSYTFNGVANSSGVFTGVAAGENLAFSITDANNCGPVNGSISVTQPSPLLLNTPLSVTVCAQSTLNLTSSASGGSPGSPIEYTYAWIGPNGFTSNLQNPFINNVSLSASGTYSVTVTDLNNCQTTNNVNVTINPLPVISIESNSPVCPNTPLTLTVNSDNSNYQYAWSGPNSFSSALQNPVLNNFSSSMVGLYTVSVTNPVTGCNKTGSVNIILGAATSISVHPIDVNACAQGQGGFITFIANANGIPAPEVQWQLSTNNGQNWSDIPGGTQYNLNINPVNYKLTDSFRAVFSNKCGPALTTSTAKMYKDNGVNFPQGTGITTATSVCENSIINFTLKASGGVGLSGDLTGRLQSSPDNGVTWNTITVVTTTNNLDMNFQVNTGTYNPDYPRIIYRITVENNGCEVESQTATLPVIQQAKMNPVSNETVCNGSFTKVINFSGERSTSYRWTNDNTNIGLVSSGTGTSIPSFQAIYHAANPSANIIVTPIFTDGSGIICEGLPQTFSITVLPSPSLPTVTSPLQYCLEVTPAPLSATAAPGNTLLWYTVSTGGTGSALAPVPPTTVAGTTTWYVSQVDGSTSCEGPRAAISVTVNPLPTATLTGGGTVCEGAITQVGFTGAGGLAPYTFTYQVNGGAETSIVTTSGNSVNLPVSTVSPGTFTYTLIKVRDSRGCEQLQNGTATVVVNPKTVITTQPAVSPVCAGGSIQMSVAAEGVNLSYRWEKFRSGSNWDPVGDNAATLTISGLQTVNSGERYRVVVTGQCGILTSSEVTITVNPVPAIFSLTSTTLCGEGTATLTLSGSQTGFTYQLQDGANNVQAPKAGTGSALNWTDLQEGTYTVVTTGVTPTNCSVTTLPFQLIEYPVPEAPNAISGERCGNGTVVLSANGCTDGILKWYASASGGTPLATGTTYTTPNLTAITTYYVSCTLNNCESARTAVTATIYPIPTVTLNTLAAVCSSALPVTITATPGTGSPGDYDYSWTVPAGAANPGNTPAFPANTGGTYSVAITSKATNCQSVSASTTLVIDPSVTVTVTTGARCQNGTPFTMTATPGSGQPQNFTYIWQVPPGATNPGNTQSFPATVEGTYTVVITPTSGSNRCPSLPASGALTVYPIPVCSIDGNNSVCPQSNNTYTGPSGMTAYSWTISGTGSISGPINAQTVTVTAGNICGSYTLSLLVTDSNGCSASCSQTYSVSDNTAPTWTTSAGSLNVTLECNDSEGLTAAQLLTPEATDNCSNFTITKTTGPYTGSVCAGATFTNTWIATDMCGNPSAAFTQLITIKPTPVAILSLPAGLPETLSCVLAASYTSAPAATYTNNISGACENSGSIPAVITPDWTLCAGGTILVTFNGTDDCGNVLTGSHTIIVEKTPAATLTLPAGLPLTLSCVEASAFSVAGLAASYANGLTGECENSGIIPAVAAPSWTLCDGGTIVLSFTGTDDCGNSLTGSHTITIQPAPPAILTLPAGMPTTLTCQEASALLPSAYVATFTNGLTGECENSGEITATFSENWTACAGGTLIINFNGSDDCGNTLTGSHSITIQPAPPAILTLPAGMPTTLTCQEASALLPSAYVATFTNGLTGECENSGEITATFSGNWTACAGGNLIINFNGSDDCGNTLTGSHSITIQPAPPAILTLPAGMPTTLTCQEASALLPSAYVATFTNGLTGECENSGTIQAVATPSWTACDGGTIRLDFTGTDDCGNPLSLSHTITVEKAPAATLTLPPGLPASLTCEQASSFAATGLVATYTNGMTGNCREQREHTGGCDQHLDCLRRGNHKA